MYDDYKQIIMHSLTSLDEFHFSDTLNSQNRQARLYVGEQAVGFSNTMTQNVQFFQVYMSHYKCFVIAFSYF